MHCNLLFAGCSFTEGAELEGISKDKEYRRTHRFSHLVSEKTGLTYANISKGGSSNETILRSTVKWFEEGNTCDHAIIQWTNRHRIEYFSEKILVDYVKAPNYHNIQPRSKEIPKHLLESFVNMQNDSNDQNNQDRCMYWMEQLLKDKCSFDYLKLRKEKEVSKEYYEIGTYYKHRPVTYIADDILKNSGIFYCIPNAKYFWLTGRHPSKLGHQKIAEYIINNFDYFQ